MKFIAVHFDKNSYLSPENIVGIEIEVVKKNNINYI